MSKIFIFIGPPFAGKETQTRLLSGKIGLPFFSMGALIRKAYEEKDPKAVEGFEKYSMKGLHIPTDMKFGFLKDELDRLENGFILDNFPATKDDLDTLLDYLKKRNLQIGKVFLLNITNEEMLRRMKQRGRKDDREDIIFKRREEQDRDREVLISFFGNLGLLVEINGNRSIEEVHDDILRNLGL
ncbi:MAG: nucleoside monophosphate kinase [Patescibacteria group bacterium]